MGFVDRRGGAEFPYHFEDVFDAILEAIKRLSGMNVARADKTSGQILVKTGINIWTVGENIPITLSRISPARTRVETTFCP